MRSTRLCSYLEVFSVCLVKLSDSVRCRCQRAASIRFFPFNLSLLNLPRSREPIRRTSKSCYNWPGSEYLVSAVLLRHSSLPLPQMDYFALLPPEITQLIFDNLESGNGSLSSPLSKALVPFQQRRLFRRIRISQWKQFEQLCKASQHHLSPLQYVEKLEVRLSPRWWSPAARERPLWNPTNSTLRLFFGRLVQLRTLDLSGLQQATSILLDPIFATTSLPNLTTLVLNTSSADFNDPFDPVDFAAIAHYTNLSSFVLSDSRRTEDILPTPNMTSTMDLSRSEVRQVSLFGALTPCEASLRRLMASFNHLERLSLVDDSETSRLYDLLDGIENREGLKELRLALSHYEEDDFDDGDPPSAPIGGLGQILLQFPSLSSLTLGNLCDVTSPSFCEALQQLSLDHLAFEKGVNLSLANLIRLVQSGGMKHQLKTIRFDNVEGGRGTRIEDIGRPYDDDEIDAWNVYSDWVLPRWTDEFKEADLVEFIEVAKRDGIEVTGTAVEAIGINREFELEHEKLDEYNYRREVITGW